MKYSKFERIIILVSGLSIAVMAVAMVAQKTDGVEVFGHLLMIPIIGCGLYWGRRGALVGFALCFSSYTAARFAWPGDLDYGTASQLVVAKLLIYAILALLCAYIRGQFRYFFVKLERQDFIDDETQIGNERFLFKELTSRINENERYEIPFSLITFTLDEGLISGLRGKGVGVLRDISTTILKNDTRSVDELARNRNNLIVILPSVGREGAEVCGKRLESKMRKYLEQHLQNGEMEKVLKKVVYEYPEDKERIDALLSRISDEVQA